MWQENVPVLVAIPGDVCGCLAVFKRLNDDGFTITHMGTGFSLDQVLPDDLQKDTAKLIAMKLQSEIPDLNERLCEVKERLPSRQETGRLIQKVIKDMAT